MTLNIISKDLQGASSEEEARFYTSRCENGPQLHFPDEILIL